MCCYLSSILSALQVGEEYLDLGGGCKDAYFLTFKVWKWIVSWLIGELNEVYVGSLLLGELGNE